MSGAATLRGRLEALIRYFRHVLHGMNRGPVGKRAWWKVLGVDEHGYEVHGARPSMLCCFEDAAAKSPPRPGHITVILVARSPWRDLFRKEGNGSLVEIRWHLFGRHRYTMQTWESPERNEQRRRVYGEHVTRWHDSRVTR